MLRRSKGGGGSVAATINKDDRTSRLSSSSNNNIGETSLVSSCWNCVESLAASFIFLTVQLAFIISLGATLNHLHGLPLLAPLTLLAATGTLICGTATIFFIRDRFPALINCSDPFAAPLVFNIGSKITTKEVAVFVPTLIVCISIALCGTAALCQLSLRFKMLKFNNFLPSQVIGGLMASVGIGLIKLAWRFDAAEDQEGKVSSTL